MTSGDDTTMKRTMTTARGMEGPEDTTSRQLPGLSRQVTNPDSLKAYTSCTNTSPRSNDDDETTHQQAQQQERRRVPRSERVANNQRISRAERILVNKLKNESSSKSSSDGLNKRSTTPPPVSLHRMTTVKPGSYPQAA